MMFTAKNAEDLPPLRPISNKSTSSSRSPSPELELELLLLELELPPLAFPFAASLFALKSTISISSLSVLKKPEFSKQTLVLVLWRYLAQTFFTNLRKFQRICN